MKPTTPFIYAAVLSVALTGGALAQSHSHNADKSHVALSTTASDTMKKMDHGAGAGSHSSKTSGHSHGAGHTASVEVPDELDTATSKLSEQQHYRVSIAPETPPVTINALHNWVLEVMTPDGKPVQNAEVSIDGGMPAHGHGLPTAPRVTEYLGDGRYLVEGVRFNMAGWWQVTFTIAGHHADRASFNIVTN
jgi:hypothetical protein